MVKINKSKIVPIIRIVLSMLLCQIALNLFFFYNSGVNEKILLVFLYSCGVVWTICGIIDLILVYTKTNK